MDCGRAECPEKGNTMDRFELLDIDGRPDLDTARNVERHSMDLDDAVRGACPRTTAEVTTAKALLAPAGLDWQVVERPILTVDREPVPSRKAIVRCDTGKVIGDVGENYGILQN